MIDWVELSCVALRWVELSWVKWGGVSEWVSEWVREGGREGRREGGRGRGRERASERASLMYGRRKWPLCQCQVVIGHSAYYTVWLIRSFFGLKLYWVRLRWSIIICHYSSWPHMIWCDFKWKFGLNIHMRVRRMCPFNDNTLPVNIITVHQVMCECFYLSCHNGFR